MPAVWGRAEAGSADFLAERLVEQAAGIRWRGRAWFPARRPGSGPGGRRPAHRLSERHWFARQRGGCGGEAFDLDEGYAAAVDVGGLPDVDAADEGGVGHRPAAHAALGAHRRSGVGTRTGPS